MNKLLTSARGKLRFLGAVSLAMLVGGATSAVVLAAIPDSNGQINACYKNTSGALQLTDPAGNCGSKFTPISWSQHAPTVLSNRLEVATGTSGEEILAVPGFGSLTVGSCDDTYGTATLSFTNNTSNNIDFGYTDDGGTYGLYTLAPSDSWTESNNFVIGTKTITLGYGVGTGSKVATTQAFTQNTYPGVTTGCTYIAQAILK